eukprot:scaffold89710_cov32-Tisochrysis_lutea.AAC.1
MAPWPVEANPLLQPPLPPLVDRQTGATWGPRGSVRSAREGARERQGRSGPSLSLLCRPSLPPGAFRGR